MKKYFLLVMFALPVWADELEEQYANEQVKEKQTFEEIVADTFDFEEYAEWTAIRQKFEAKANKENEHQLACVAKGKKAKICVDPNWCLYPSNFDKDECVWYKIKHGF